MGLSLTAQAEPEPVHNMSQPSGQPTPTSPPLVDGNEVQAVKTASRANPSDTGVGVYHIPTNRVHLIPISQTHPYGHTAFVRQLGLTPADCRGFVIALAPGGQFVVENISGLNRGSGGATSFQMPQPLFDGLKRAVIAAGL